MECGSAGGGKMLKGSPRWFGIGGIGILLGLSVFGEPLPSAAKWDPTMQGNKPADERLFTWIDGRDLPLEGKAFPDAKADYDRLPADVPADTPAGVRDLQRHSAGLQFRFTTTSRLVCFRWELISSGLSMHHMPMTGASGIDIYVKKGDGAWHIRRGGFPGVGGNPPIGRTEPIEIAPGTPICVNLPLYNGVRSFALGVEPGSTVAPLPPHAGARRPVVFYGTSITQGGCCSRPGLSFVNIIGRELDVEVVNLGFSGCTKMELGMSELLARIDASCYVIDCASNMSLEQVKERFEPFVRNLRARCPETPILLAEEPDVFGRPWTDEGRRQKNAFTASVYRRLVGEGWRNLAYLPKDGMYPDEDCTVDHAHPNDCGMRALATAFGGALRGILGQAPGTTGAGRAQKATFERRRLFPGFDGRFCKVQPAVASDGRGTALLTYQRLLLSGSDVFYGQFISKSTDGGKTWSEPKEITSLVDEWKGKRRITRYGNPHYSARNGRWFGIGCAQAYDGDEHPVLAYDGGDPYLVPQYVEVDAEKGTYGASKPLPFPFDYEHAMPFGQWLECENGDILQPFYFKPRGAGRTFRTVVVRYRFAADGLEVAQVGKPIVADHLARGLYEPSLARLGDRYYLTLRTDEQGMLATSADGLSFSEPKPWKWDDGTLLENRNTQQHWLGNGRSLYLAYTRVDRANGHVFRNRAPIFMARFDPERECLVRETEVPLVPELGARLGNYVCCPNGSDETWLVTAEWMQPRGCEKYGSDNSLWLVKVKLKEEDK